MGKIKRGIDRAEREAEREIGRDRGRRTTIGIGRQTDWQTETETRIREARPSESLTASQSDLPELAMPAKLSSSETAFSSPAWRCSVGVQFAPTASRSPRKSEHVSQFTRGGSANKFQPPETRIRATHGDSMIAECLR